MANAQHHDAVTGTNKQHMANDYAKTLSLGYTETKKVVNEEVIVHDSEGRKVESQLIPLVDAYVNLRNYYVKAYLGSKPNVVPKYWLAFTISVPTLGFSTYTISTSRRIGVGFNSILFDRINYQDRIKRKKTQGFDWLFSLLPMCDDMSAIMESMAILYKSWEVVSDIKRKFLLFSFEDKGF